MSNVINVSCQLIGRINFAMQQNYVPVFRNLVLTNPDEKTYENVTVSISFEPEFAKPFTAEIPVLSPEKPVEISPVRIIVSSEYLYSLTEKINGNVHIEVKCQEKILFSQDENIELYAYDQWLGTLVMPELTSAFITPNHPKISEITSKAGMFLNKWTGDPSFTGYQSKNPNIVKKQAAALYAALQAENIAYTMPPASYEKLGQRVRLPHAVLEQKCGTCFDLSLLYAACAEAVGLNPLVVFLKGHAFAGVWLEEETFAESIEDDISALTKRIAAGIDAICLLECTDFTAGRNVDFDHAVKHANDNLLDEENFDFTLDVCRSRSSGIRPIPVRIVQDGVFTAVDYGKRKENEVTSAPSEIDLSMRRVANTEQDVTRQVIWERKLLDINLKNNLLNFRPSASNIQFMTSDLSVIEDKIAGGDEFKIMPAPQDISLVMSDSKIFEIENDKDLITAIAEGEFKNKRLRTFISPIELEKILKKLHRQAKVSIEENGANTLYLALGLLRWFETDKSERPRYAPLVLIPVDIIRKIQDRSYSLRIRDEETQMNITLIEMLRQNFGINITGLNPPPHDESGVDLPLVFNTIRNAILSKNRWDIVETAFLGQFSFSHFIMWNDIKNRSEELAKNKTVASIISGKLEWTPQSIEFSAKELDENVLPSDMAVPLSVDSSQLSAVYAAAKGESFVLHGPPGTGKSQTITNMIANALYNGKSVLFVAEKMAALSVVQKRLESIGLDPFCLELHSNKTQKKVVLSQLDKALASSRIKAPEDFEKTAEQLHCLRKELNGIMKEIHKILPIGFSLYDAVVRYDRLSQQKNLVSVSKDYVSKVDKNSFEKTAEILKSITAVGKECGGLKASPLKNYHNREYSLEIREAFEKTAEKLISQAESVVKNYSSLAEGLLIPKPLNLNDFTCMLNIIYDASRFDYLENSTTSDTILNRKEDIEKVIEGGKAYCELSGKLSEEYENTFFDLDPSELKLDFKRNEQKWFLPKLLGKNKLVKEMKLHSKNPENITAENYISICESLEEYSALKNTLNSTDREVCDLFGKYWNNENTDFTKLQQVFEKSVEIKSNLDMLSGSKGELVTLLSEIPKDNSLKTKAYALSEALNKTYHDLCDTMSVLEDTYKVDLAEAKMAENWLEALKNEGEGLKNGVSLLRERTTLENLICDAKSCGVEETVQAYVDGAVCEENLCEAFECALCKGVISSVLEASPELASFQSTQFEQKLDKYREINDRFAQLTIQELVARLSAKVPDASSGVTTGTSELSILQKAIRSGGRMLPIRKLFDSIPNLLRRICPCMLMSPISVAQYIDPSFPKFDLVIFDEASQLPTSEAVGAIARGENVIVVGDPKQLPPTSFFSVNHIDEENYDKEDLESVLDDCLALGMPQKHLLWHYRSRHESLIAFSNAKFYENSLLTFPSPADLVSEVKWVNVEGYYDKGKTKQTVSEAKAIIAEIVRRLTDENLRKKSIGVVTFSLVQQNLIDDMLAEEYMKNPQLEQLANEMHEPIFIKNLENVQGDERDVILFSIGYGPDKDGKVSMNFGPVNRDGGWRRLNVAVSRARYEMIVYSVIRPEQIDLSRTRSEGVAQLKAFLEYAAKGRPALAVNSAENSSNDESFALAVSDELEKLGFETKCSIGCSGYKIDVGIVNPDNPSEFILAVMCDSRKNISQTTARDRNVVQPSVLKGLGWNICDVHVLDWLDNKQRVIDKIKREAEEALKKYRENPQETVSEAPKASFVVEFAREEETKIEDLCEKYVSCNVEQKGTPESFYEPYSLKEIKKTILEIVNTEAPVSKKATEKKVLSAWGISRSGSRVSKVFNDALYMTGVKVSVSNNGEFLWKEGQVPEEYKLCRISGSDTKRNMEDICTEEIANGILVVLKNQIAMYKADLVHATAKLFGFTRTGGTIEQSVNTAIDYAVNHGFVNCDNDGKITLVD